MKLNSKVLVGVPVRTKMGLAVGRLASLELDSDTGRLTSLLVRGKGVVAGLLEDQLVVSWSQVVSMSDKEIVVQDNFSPAGAVLAKKGLAEQTM